jgi:hypothetical protein
MTNRCPYCGEAQYNTISLGEQYRCGTIVGPTESIQHRYCQRLCNETDQNRKAKRPAMIRETIGGPRATVNSRWKYVRDQIFLMQPGQTIYIDNCDRNAAHKAAYHVTGKLAHKVVFRHDKNGGKGCHVSMLGNVEGMEVGDCRIYSDSLRHTLTRLHTLNWDALQFGGQEVYTFELVEGIFWIRRVR